jgi:acetoacetate decarboxylase
MPDHCPLYPELPYQYRGYRKLSAFCRTDADALARAMPEGLSPLSDIMEVFVMDVPDGGPLGAYQEGGIVVPCRYGDRTGAHVLYELVSTDDSLCVGREIWGYPKKLADVRWAENDDGTINASIARRGHPLIEMHFTPGEGEFDKPVMQPRLQVKRFPCVDGARFDVDQVILNEVGGAVLHERRTGVCNVGIGGWEQDPLHELPAREVIGAEFVVGDFLLGAGSVLEERAKA